jgi:hypothetical protein
MRIVSDRDFIIEIEDVLDAGTCAALVAAFDASPDVRDGRVFHMDRGEETSPDKVSFDWTIPTDGPFAALHECVHRAVSEAILAILPGYPGLQIDALGSTGYKIQKYRRGEGHFTWHVDAFGPLAESRLLALVLYLNDVEQGGETEFHHQARRIRPRAGRAVLFPTAWTHMHRGNVPESGDKYVISSFFEFPRTGSDGLR